MTAQPNYRKTLLACYLGFITQAISANFAPLLFLTFSDSYGIPLSVVLYAMGAGLVEVLISPIVEACPFENKAGVMSLLHSFYCWGAVGVILGSTVFFAIFGLSAWKILALIWAAVPLLNTVNFLTCPIERLVEEDEGLRPLQLFRLPLFMLLIVLMICVGASEATMTQWASAFTESALGVSKTVGDLVGPCLFAVFMGLARVFYGKRGEGLDLVKVMLVCGAMAVVCYLVAALSPVSVVGLIGCALCGLAVGILWPGTISVSARSCPKGGTAMFAFLALAGDLGAAVGPTMVGGIAEAVGGDLKIGLLFAAAFPAALILGLALLLKIRKRG